ncbi:MAG: DEAD/DEAH box helicase family protein, partial [Bacteroidetes bacterium]|nr:DEAD/DEAH box helicase family protein [Bacteroidota bacterium]
ISFFQKDIALFDQIESSVCQHRLRYYQMEALYELDYLLGLGDSNTLKRGLMEKVSKDAKRKTPFMGFEMATGSGKTMLMGASCYYLYRKYGINNFLIVAPSSIDIYQKTIRNFTKDSFDSIWSGTTDLDFNLITGDDYQTPSMFFDDNKDVNFFIFNIDKFGANATNSKKRWESSVWKDSTGNTISIQAFLKEKRLAIITDEAHHSQSRKAKQIIGGFNPELVLEFTATAIEQSRNQEKANQSIIYKYDIRKFLEDGHGKLVRAVALDNEDRKSRNKNVFSDAEKLKIVTLLLIHLVKKSAVLKDDSCKGLKPVAFVKVKNDTIFTQKVYKYILEELSTDLDNLSIILEKAGNQDLEITNLITTLVKEDYGDDIELLRQDINSVCKNTLFYHGKSSQEEKKLFDNIRKNHIEIVVYMQKLDEGIDLPNIYSMAVINDTDTEFKTSVKQIIGRGVRLNKNIREFDNSNDLLLTQAEKLHIVSDRGANFEDVILSIQKEFGLTDKYLSSEQPKKQIWNEAKSNLLEGKYLPKIQADFKVRDDIQEVGGLRGLVENTERIVQDYLGNNCFADVIGEEHRFIKYLPSSFFIEVDVFSDQKQFHQEIQKAGGIQTSLPLSTKDFDDIYSKVQKSLLCLSDTKHTRSTFYTYMDRFNQIGLQYYRNDDADEKLVLNKFKDTFSYFYRNYIEKNYYTLQFKEIFAEDSWPLKESFKDHQIILPSDQIGSNKLGEPLPKSNWVDLIKQNYRFTGYINSIFDYVKFDSYTEKSLADYMDRITSVGGKGLVPFWVRNERNIYFEYGSHKYFPDFLMLYKDKIFVIEAKGEAFSNTMKNALLTKLNDLPGDEVIKGYRGVLIFESQAESIAEGTSWEQFLDSAEEIASKKTQSENLETKIDEEAQFMSYLPAYTPRSAKRLFIDGRKKVRREGWLKVDGGPYPMTTFAIQVKGAALLPEYGENDWIILDSNIDQSQVQDSLVLFFDEDKIDDYYTIGYTVRSIKIEKIEDGSIFGSHSVQLRPLNTAFPSIDLGQVTSYNELNIVGMIYR